MSYVKHQSRAATEAMLSSQYFDETHSIQYGFGVRKGRQWFVFYDQAKQMNMPIAVHPEFSDKHASTIKKYTVGGPESISSSGLNKLGNKGQHPKSDEAFGEVWEFGSVGRFVDLVLELEVVGALK